MTIHFLSRKSFLLTSIVLTSVLFWTVLSYAQSLESALEASLSGIIAHRIKLSTVAKNVANLSTLRVEETGLPYQKEYTVFEAYKGGVRVKSIEKSTEPFFNYPDGGPPQSSGGYTSFPNINLPEEMMTMSYSETMIEANIACYKNSKQLYQQTIDILK